MKTCDPHGDWCREWPDRRENVEWISTAQRDDLPTPSTSRTEGEEEELPIGAHGVIGDGFTCALVRVDGVIDWHCLPRFDSPSVFGAILDPKRGGRTGITPVARPFESLQRYDPDTNILETLFMVPGQGQVRLTDYMPCTGDPRASIHEIHRRIECREGSVELEACFDPRFGYGSSRTRLEVGQHGVLARGRGGGTPRRGPRHELTLGTATEGGRIFAISHAGRRATLDGALLGRAGSAAHTSLSPLRTAAQNAAILARLVATSGLRRPVAPRRHAIGSAAQAPDRTAPTGGMVAAPTSSLPEWLGGTRNWDYRFTWTRDTAMAVRAGNLLGYEHEARDFFHFIRDALDRGDGLGIMYTVDGDPVPEERVLSHLAGHGGSRPVRIGNGARDQSQLDTAGALVDAAFLYERFGGSLTLRAWRHLRRVIDCVSQRWREPDHGIWEVRCTPRHNVHSKIMSWVALDRGSRLAQLFGELLEGPSSGRGRLRRSTKTS